MNPRKTLIMLGFTLASLFSPLASFAEPPVLASQLFEVFEYQEDEVPALLSFHLIGKRLFLEQSGMAYWAAEVYLDNPADLVCAPIETTVTATVKRFSGFSNAGQFWDDGRKATITVSGKKALTLSIDGETPIQAIRSRSGRSIHAIPSQPAPEPSALMDSWTSADGSVSAAFRKDGTMVFMTVNNDTPAEVYFGSYTITDQHIISYTAERLGWGGMPHEGRLSFSCEGGTLSLRSMDGTPSILGSSRHELILNHATRLLIM